MEIFKKIKNLFNEPVYQVGFILFLFLGVMVSSVSFTEDTSTFSSWCGFIFKNGIGNAYKAQSPPFNYPPLITYLLSLFGKFEGSEDKINCYFYFFKLFALLADFLAAYALISFIGNKKREILFLLLLIANPIFIYNSYCWGQVDGVLSLLVFMAFVSFMKEKLLWGIFFFTLAINFKLQAIIFIPPLALLAYYKMHENLRLKYISMAFFVFILTQIFILIPFIITGEVKHLAGTIFSLFDYYPVVCISAFNIWSIIFGDATDTSDKLQWLHITYKNWGLLMFMVSSTIVLLPLFIQSVYVFFKKKYCSLDNNSLFITFALIPLLFFYFTTQMHERYSHPALIFIAAFAFSTSRYWVFFLMCLAYFGNMESVLHYFNLPYYDAWIFDPDWGAYLYLSLILSLLYFLYKPFVGQLINRKKLSATG